MRSEEMHMQMTRAAMTGELKVMMFQIGEAVRHVLFAGLDCFLPNRAPSRSMLTSPATAAEVSANHQLRTNTALAQLRSGEIEIVTPLKFVIGELVAGAHTNAKRRAVCRDEVDPGDLGFFAAVFGMRGNGQRRERALAEIEPSPL